MRRVYLSIYAYGTRQGQMIDFNARAKQVVSLRELARVLWKNCLRYLREDLAFYKKYHIGKCKFNYLLLILYICDNKDLRYFVFFDIFLFIDVFVLCLSIYRRIKFEAEFLFLFRSLRICNILARISQFIFCCFFETLILHLSRFELPPGFCLISRRAKFYAESKVLLLQELNN